MGQSLDIIVPVLHDVASGQIDLTRDCSLNDIQQLIPEGSAIRHCRDQLDVEILTHLIDGRSNEFIAETCNYAIQTVRNRLVRLMSLANVDNRTQLATQLLRI